MGRGARARLGVGSAANRGSNGGEGQAVDLKQSLAELPLFSVLIGADGRICELNAVAERLLGSERGALIGTEMGELADAVTQPRLAELLSIMPGSAEPVVSPLTLQRADGRAVPVLAAIWGVLGGKGEKRLQIVAIDDALRVTSVRELESRAEMLAGFIDASSEAMWCMEYTEPVDLRCSVQEIIRQVFENDCHWRMCNAAMAALYSLPDGLDFNRQPVSAYFRRTPENEAFVRQLIESRFHIDAAPSLEYRHDGKIFYVENSVRCHMEGDLMFRMWGTVRDITEFRTAHNALAARKREVTEILSALPDAVLVVDLSRKAIALNPAFESTFGWPAEEVLGKDVSPIIDLETSRPGLSRWFAPTPSRWIADVISSRGESCRCDVRIAPLPDDTDRRFVMSLRPLVSDKHKVHGKFRARSKLRKAVKKKVSGRRAFRSS
jgi:PAS domain S-box-containing protein